MFTVEIKINGSLIGHIYARNVKDVGLDECEYAYEYYEPESRGLTKGKVRHRRKDGIRPLVGMILGDVGVKKES
jgi:hypothetical protein